VDHGKTSLIKALTSIDTDRLPEEKQRGMSIDVGFAFVDLQKINTRVEIIDVPGHERFLKNAIAGLSSAQGLILVVDANEGLMPQTAEHLKLAKSFGIEHCIVAITKIDRADPELIKLVKEDVEEFLRKENVKCFGFYLVSSKEGIGFDELKEGIAHHVESLPEPPKDAFFRMSVDSAFHKQVKERLLDLIQNSKGVIKLAEVVSKLKITQGILGYILKDLRGYTVVEGYLLDEKSAKIEELESFKKLMEFMQFSIKEENDLFNNVRKFT